MSLSDFSQWLFESPHGEVYTFLREILANETAFIAGGAVRDFVQGRSAARVSDLDVMIVHSHISDIFAQFDARFPHESTAFGNRKYTIFGSTVDVFPSADVNGSVLPPEQAVQYLDLTASAMLVDLQGGPIHDFVGGRIDAENRHARPLARGWALAVAEQIRLVRRLLALIDRGVFESADWDLPLRALESGTEAGVEGMGELRERMRRASAFDQGQASHGGR